MKRLLEPELMEDESQIKAYAEADFEIPHNEFIQRLRSFIGDPEFGGTALDLGCGPGDISCRFAKAFPLSRVHAVDGSEPMLNHAKSELATDLSQRIGYIQGLLPDLILPQSSYEIIFSNSLLHHLPDPQALWQTIKKYSRPGTRIIIMDLLRPASIQDAQTMVANYTANEPEVLQRDFYHSLLAAFSMKEIVAQLAKADLNLHIEQISDRHVFITGVIPDNLRKEMDIIETVETMNLESPELYINRDLSLLEFNKRVLAQAKNEAVPLLERLNYLCISCSNLDEFFEVRVASVLEMVAIDPKAVGPDGLTPKEQLEQISIHAHKLVDEQYQVLNEILIPELNAENIRFIRRNDWTEAQQKWLANYFNDELLPILTPVGLDSAHPHPGIKLHDAVGQGSRSGHRRPREDQLSAQAGDQPRGALRCRAQWCGRPGLHLPFLLSGPLRSDEVRHPAVLGQLRAVNFNCLMAHLRQVPAKCQRTPRREAAGHLRPRPWWCLHHG